LQELYDHKFYPEPIIEEGLCKPRRDVDWSIMSSCCVTLSLAGLICKSKGEIFLTALTNELLEKDNRTELFRIILHKFIRKFNWGVNDGYAEMHIIQQNAAFPIFMLHQCGNEFRSSRFYTDCLLKAYPKITEVIRIIDGEEDIESFHRCFQTRFFERFTEWFGLTESSGERYSFNDESRQFKTTPLFNAVFYFD